MIDDFHRAVEAGSDLEFDLCIAGAGAAGITLATALADSGLRICLLEGGGLEPPGPDGLDPYRGEVTDRPYPLPGSRLRYFGGSTNHWGGWCRPLDAIDFEIRSHVPLSGWPITRADLDVYYDRAHRICQIPHPDYDPAGVEVDAPTLLPTIGDFSSKLFRFSPPTRFGRTYRAPLAAARSVTVLTGANVVGLRRRGRRIDAARVSSLDGNKSAIVRAARFVLAMGGIENARMLLLPADGSDAPTVHDGDFVGRCFMDHFGFTPGYWLAPEGLRYFRFTTPRGDVLPMLSMSEQGLRNRGLRGFGIMAQPDAPDPTYTGAALTNPGFAEAAWGDAHRYRLVFMNEATPNPDSRVTLLAERDAIGVPRVRLDWRINSEDFENIDRVMQALARTLGAAGLARVQVTRRATDPDAVGSANMHHMGTTRMSASPRTGVVDADCRVHGLDNLFVAGSSVFPTAGFCNPTLTIVALAARLADHLRAGVKS
ncbi:MAG: GMC family oxidoreductase [Pseudomonadota bacterium]